MPVVEYNHYPAEGYGIKCEGSFLVRKVRVVVFRNVFIFLSPPLLCIIYIGLNPTFVDMILVWSS